MGTETEYKLAVRDAALLARVLDGAQIAAYRQEPYRSIRMRTTYFDTADGFLAARKWMLRLRTENGRCVATMKTPGGGHTRGEWECEADTLAQALPQLAALGAPQEIQTLDPAGLRPVCGAEFTRRTARLRLPDGTACMVCGDAGKLTGGGREVPLCELELELAEGSQDTLGAFVQTLQTAYGLREELQSKLRRARALAE